VLTVSYILEALKKSDHQRAGRTGGFTQLSSYVFMDDQGSGRRGLLLLAVVMLLTGLVIGWWRPGASGKVTMALPPVVPLAAVGDATVVPVVPSEPVAATVSSTAPPSRRSAPTTAAVSTRSAPPVVKPATSVAATAAASAVEPSRDVGPPLTHKPEAQPVAKVAEHPASPATPTAAARPAADRVVEQADLPSGVRSLLPRLTVAGFAGNDDAQSRFAVINEQIVREGEEIAPGVRLESVADDGVVLAYRGYRFRPMP
jgi:general secretion pathway protein B